MTDRMLTVIESRSRQARCRQDRFNGRRSTSDVAEVDLSRRWRRIECAVIGRRRVVFEIHLRWRFVSSRSTRPFARSWKCIYLLQSIGFPTSESDAVDGGPIEDAIA